MERKLDEWEKSQDVSSEQTDRTDPPPPPQAHAEQVNVIFTRSGKFLSPVCEEPDFKHSSISFLRRDILGQME
ncbi:hypothetical protein Tco_0769950 [Tanacetum coccineum]|uniref:Uncharacterized protein n=1 Tax=Tanacetum coccineum TaxID=301880 RepID=A0ABQ4ZAT8_9ASTR